MTPARSLATMLGLGLAVSFGPATAASAHRVPACDRAASDVPDEMNKHCQPEHEEGDINGDGKVDAADVRRADTGFGGSAGTGSETTILLVGGGVLALGAAFGVRRARGARA